MSREKTERLFNLTLALLGTRNFLTKSQILTSVQGYEGPSESADRMFERDKDDLRELGIPIEVKQIDPLFDDEPGYRIDRRRYQLPPLSLTAREMALLGVAAQAWEEAALAGAAHDGLRKLVASGAEPDPDFEAHLIPSLASREPAFPIVWSAVREGRPLKFEYRRSSADPYRERAVDPWGLISRQGLWYLVARDHESDQPKTFRLSRMRQPHLFGKAGSVQVPEGIDIWSHARLLEPVRPDALQARIKCAPGRGTQIRLRGVEVAPDEYLIAYNDEEILASDVASYGPALTVLEPKSLRVAVARLHQKAVEIYG